MVDVAAARAELNRIEAFLRTRYHYPHPIFGHMAAALEHLEGELPMEAQGQTGVEAASQEEPVSEGSTETGAALPSDAYTPPPAPEQRPARQVGAPRRGRRHES